MINRSVVNALRAFPWSDYRVYYAVLFGSIVKKGVGRDIDIAVEFINTFNLGEYSRLLTDLAEYLSIDNVDLVPISDETDCYLIHEAFSDGMILYMASEEAWFRMHRRASICEDFLMDAAKLNIVENAAHALVKRWRS
ncbi:MAG: nucleotidyltransferase family protein [Caldivirga sp.]|uniref:nucleotidyltransferase family protein n=1 Tax=Caldivirga sp. TaxID=2080243 RepID=UPI003D09FA6C